MKITNLKKRLGTFVLEINSLEIESGCIHGFIGGNGSGKTTAAKLIAGILEPDEGKIQYEGLEAKDITMTFQRPYMLHASVYENLVYPLKIRNIKPNEAEMDDILNKCNLLNKKKQYARTLSSGEQQKLSFLRTMIFKPKLVIIDETLSNLSAESLELFENLISETQQAEKITWILISHQPVLINKLCDMIHFFSDGKIIESGKKESVIFHSKNLIVREYMKKQALEWNSIQNDHIL
jgi:ABC-type multidrug transport system ATPase subunit